MAPRARPADGRIATLLDVLDAAFARKGWHGPPLMATLRPLDPETALWRPGPGRHNIWEIALHTAYWKYIARRRIAGGAGGRFPRPGSNHPKLPARPDAGAWEEDLALIQNEHDLLREVVAALSPSRLDKPVGRAGWTAAATIHGVAAHDAYHAGQIRLIHRMSEERGTHAR